MAAGLGSFSGDAENCHSAQCHFLQRCRQCCENGHQGPQALSLLAVLQRTAGLPNGISFLAAINAFEKGTQWQQVLGLLAAVQQSAVLPNGMSFS